MAYPPPADQQYLRVTGRSTRTTFNRLDRSVEGRQVQPVQEIPDGPSAFGGVIFRQRPVQVLHYHLDLVAHRPSHPRFFATRRLHPLPLRHFTQFRKQACLLHHTPLPSRIPYFTAWGHDGELFTNSEADGGNRRLNRVLYIIALTQWNHGGAGRRYIERRMEQGKSWLEAVRALKRFIARAVWRLWQRHYAQTPRRVRPWHYLTGAGK